MPVVSLRDELFLLAHDDGGRMLATEPAIGAGLAGATLIDLLLQGRVAVGHGRLDVIDSALTGDPEADATLAAIAANASPGPRAWVSWISDGAYARVAQNLERAGVVRRSTVRRLGLMSATRCLPVRPEDLVRVRSRVRYALYAKELPEPGTAALCGLVRVLRLEASLLLSMPTSDLLLGLERLASANDLTIRQVTNAVETIITASTYR